MKRLLITVVGVLFLLIFSGCSQKVDKKPITISTEALYLYDSKVEGFFTGNLNSDKLPEGIGKFDCQSSKIGKWTYEGEFANGTITGKGKLVYFDDGATYEGSFNNGQLVKGVKTKGKMQWTGAFVNGELHGVGVFKRGDGYVLEGNFSEGKPNGEIKVKYQGNDYATVTYDQGVPKTFKDSIADYTMHKYEFIYEFIRDEKASNEKYRNKKVAIYGVVEGIGISKVEDPNWPDYKKQLIRMGGYYDRRYSKHSFFLYGLLPGDAIKNNESYKKLRPNDYVKIRGVFEHSLYDEGGIHLFIKEPEILPVTPTEIARIVSLKSKGF